MVMLSMPVMSNDFTGVGGSAPPTLVANRSRIHGRGVSTTSRSASSAEVPVMATTLLALSAAIAGLRVNAPRPSVPASRRSKVGS